MGYQVTRVKAPIFEVKLPEQLWVKFEVTLTDKSQRPNTQVGWRLKGDLVVNPFDVIDAAEIDLDEGREYVVKALLLVSDGGTLVVDRVVATPKWTDEELSTIEVLRRLVRDDLDKLFELAVKSGAYDVLKDMFEPLVPIVPTILPVEPWDALYTVTVTEAPANWRPLYRLVRMFCGVPAFEAKRLATTDGAVLMERVDHDEARELTEALDDLGIEHTVDITSRRVGGAP